MPGRLAIFNDMDFKNDSKNIIKNDMVKQLHKRYNIAPTMPIPVLLNNGNYLYAHFGYLPSWAKSKTSMNINARSESIFEKITFRESFKFRRCLIPINGFYEWEVKDKEKKPFFVSSKENSYFAVAGVWDEWFDKELNMSIVTVALITCDANEKLAEVHHRMPVVVEKDDYSKWLYSDDLKELNSLHKVYPSEKIDIYEVKDEVNKVLYDNPSCINKEENSSENKGQLSLF